jgi:hypothetical protein
LGNPDVATLPTPPCRSNHDGVSGAAPPPPFMGVLEPKPPSQIGDSSMVSGFDVTSAQAARLQ